MNAADTGSDKTFTGKLIKRHYKRGQQYAQLVFESRHGKFLSLSRDPETVKSLRVGQRYRVAGPEFAVGEKTFIHEPRVAPASRKRLAIGFAVVFFFVLTGTVFAARHFAAAKNVAAQANNTPTSFATQQTGVEGDNTVTDATTNPVTPAAQPAATTPTTTTTKKKTAPNTSSTSQGSSAGSTTSTPQTTTPSTDTPTTPTTDTPPESTDTPAAGDTTKPSDGDTTTPPPTEEPTPPPTVME
ncbi:MAG TPA: hypothetical protein VLF62_03350 [Candidatus Saccharimonadales bacterium]|nr:hypothetical protein [Candidatus Saccharimonadales bacterium]